MSTEIYNPLAGKNSSGSRFRFRVRSIAHQNLYLPETMRNLPQVRQLIDGVSPLVVFNCNDINVARHTFYELRKKFDFPYWAALEYTVPDKRNHKNFVKLRFNLFQRYLADVFINRAEAGLSGKYIISKSVSKCGLTTVVQAYILWLQLYQNSHHSLTCTHSTEMMDTLKTNVARNIHKQGGRNIVYVTNDASSLFQSVYTPNILDRCSSSYVHLADMSKWLDPTAEVSDHIYSIASNGWLKTPPSLFVLEGDYPSNPNFRLEDHRNYHIQESLRLMRLKDFNSNPFFLNKLVIASDPKVFSEFYHINLDNALYQKI